MYAKFLSTCGWCGLVIDQGEIIASVEGVWMHEDCADTAALANAEGD